MLSAEPGPPAAPRHLPVSGLSREVSRGGSAPSTPLYSRSWQVSFDSTEERVIMKDTVATSEALLLRRTRTTPEWVEFSRIAAKRGDDDHQG